jgi:tRNA A37 threonylcarbamoyladenosine modification protein TsaB
MILIINTCIKKSFEVILLFNKNNFKIKKINGDFNCAERILVEIDKLLIKNRVGVEKIKSIGVVVGPGGFTSVRIGVAVANALSYALKLPVIEIKNNDFSDNNTLINFVFLKSKDLKKIKLATPFYDRKPNIGNPKK